MTQLGYRAELASGHWQARGSFAKQIILLQAIRLISCVGGAPVRRQDKISRN